jgi:hypothetical protein
MSAGGFAVSASLNAVHGQNAITAPASAGALLFGEPFSGRALPVGDQKYRQNKAAEQPDECP